MTLQPIDPRGWAAPKGYSNGMLVPAGRRLLFVAGQVAWDGQQKLVGRGDFVVQFRQALANVLEVVRSAGGGPSDLAQLTIYVLDRRDYAARARQLSPVWRELCGRHYPAMALVEVAGLLEDGALLEIQAIAALA